MLTGRSPLRSFVNLAPRCVSRSVSARGFSTRLVMGEPANILLVGLGSIGSVYAHILERVGAQSG
jgi:hypothetical protein